MNLHRNFVPCSQMCLQQTTGLKIKFHYEYIDQLTLRLTIFFLRNFPMMDHNFSIRLDLQQPFTAEEDDTNKMMLNIFCNTHRERHRYTRTH